MPKTTNRLWGFVRRGAGGLAVALLACVSPAQAQKADNIHDLLGYLGRCLGPTEGAIGTEITVFFALRRDGSLLGKPRVTFAKMKGDAEDQRRFVEGTAAAFARCLPAPITDALGGAIAGRGIALHLKLQAPQTDI